MKIFKRMWASNWPEKLFWIIIGGIVGVAAASIPEMTAVRNWQPLIASMIALAAASASIWTMREGQLKADRNAEKQRFEPYRNLMQEFAEMLRQRDAQKILNVQSLTALLSPQCRDDIAKLHRAEHNLKINDRARFISIYVDARNSIIGWVDRCLEEGLFLEYTSLPIFSTLDVNITQWQAEYRKNRAI